MSARGSALRRWLLAGGAVALALALAELGSRIVGAVWYLEPPRPLPEDTWRGILHQRSSLPRLTHELAPGRSAFRGVPIRTNRFGMRDDEVTLEKPPGVRRIAALGDSYTFGWGVPVESAYPEVLERLLPAGPPGGASWQVLNFGVSAYSSVDEAIVLRERALAFAPDVVLVGYVLNDPESAPIEPLKSYFQEPALWQRSHLLRRIAKAWRDLEVRRLGKGDVFVYLHAQPEKWNGVVEALGEIGALCRAARVPAVLVIFPMIPAEGWEGYRYRALHEQVAQAGAAAGLEVLDLLGPFEQAPAARLWLRPDDPHPNVLGHRIAAEAIRAHLARSHPELVP